MVNIEELLDEVENVLKSFGYTNIKREDQDMFYRIGFTSPWNLGSEGFKRRHMDAIILLTKGYLTELFYLSDRHHVLLRKELRGLDPDDDRYSTLIYTAMEVPHTEVPCCEVGKEVFVNNVDHFTRCISN